MLGASVSPHPTSYTGFHSLIRKVRLHLPCQVARAAG